MSEAASAAVSSTEAPAASAVETAATQTTQTPAVPVDVLGKGLLGGALDAPAVVDPAAKPADGAAEGEAAKAAVTAPDYSALKLPEGVEASDPLLEAFKATAGELNIPAEAAQALMDKVLPQFQAQAQTQIAAEVAKYFPTSKATVEGWEKELRADPEIGGSKLTPAATEVARAMAVYGNPEEIKAALNATGAGSHPVLFKWLHRMSLAVSEGTAVTNGGPSTPKASAASKLYNNSPGSVAS